jgi:nicotinamide mononucleotide transporter
MNIPMPSWPEIAAIIFTVLCIFLAGRNNVHTWWTGIVGCIFYGFTFYEAKLYADVALQGFFVLTGIVGWMMWEKDLDSRPQRYLSWPQFAACTVVGLVIAAGYAAMLVELTDSPVPYADSTLAALSVVAQLLLMSRFVQNWPMWVIVNIISVPLYWSRELYLSSILYAVFLVHAIYATWYWLKLNKGSKGAYSAPAFEAPYKVEAP